MTLPKAPAAVLGDDVVEGLNHRLIAYRNLASCPVIRRPRQVHRPASALDRQTSLACQAFDHAPACRKHLLVKDDQAVVELHSLATAKNGLRFDNRYCWVVHFDGDTIDRVRAYLDSETKRTSRAVFR